MMYTRNKKVYEEEMILMDKPNMESGQVHTHLEPDGTEYTHSHNEEHECRTLGCMSVWCFNICSGYHIYFHI